jgi:hypothetical protein
MSKRWRGRLWMLCAVLLSCGDSREPEAAAGAAAPLTIGDACQTSCGSGTFCSHAGVFDGQCTTSCGNDQGCTLIAPEARCFGTTNGQCGIPCLDVSECPAGQNCELIGNEFACVLP